MRVDPAALNNEAIESARKNRHSAVVEVLKKDRRVMRWYDLNTNTFFI
jgi:hypothetical protein